ncbi:TIGR03086 family metal-binding protein [Williamsia sterculiae]|uniref:TIGR03086 family protein n=1 Tax=Williamsia sterculiae TaxID=1344003 RepID=A0A1N7GXU5_9NOCA|nr:TIGR03086 family metal-binding protein [Williamsia sterculiae]SIS17427.1 TIGR03086 family protein [Williamsia sterculiae]
MSIPDPRPSFTSATAWAETVLRGVRDDQLSLPTPCADWTVAQLCGHLVGTARRAEALADGRDVFTVDAFPAVHKAQPYADAAAHARELWSDDATLDAMMQVPWGRIPGRGALWGYVNEALVHGWDLAVATGQPASADPSAAETTLAVVRSFITPEIRTDAEVPFGAVVEPHPDADPTEQLANWSGRDTEPWLGRRRAAASV